MADLFDTHFGSNKPNGTEDAGAYADKALHDSSQKSGVDQIPAEVLLAWGEIFRYGATKYSRDNWKKGTDWHQFYGSTLRHLFKWWLGETVDPESGLPHLAHAIWNVGALMYYQLHGLGMDDRQVASALVRAASSPTHTDLMVAPEELDEWLKDNPPPSPAPKSLADMVRESLGITGPVEVKPEEPPTPMLVTSYPEGSTGAPNPRYYCDSGGPEPHNPHLARFDYNQPDSDTPRGYIILENGSSLWL